ncbi:uncharacterized protein Z519_05393 [Cladophialophora bantiana CBS 173.52]|uniref:Uncharacterized protein n=1 Tax=Cladophialophora bantiana (strain ATCC 10958 / CBS 173.52 / CDC B-1940 / NIH 8579) TaxID=1442370 RepID=A0A0D2G667_CLAB1|nr:uncharacterized protein Z519_05393 [Cladophialophora bantiana CBS 173.52]KIW94077.1 hypothetical protein Z519_05393 [Cladophialophora bantiana CBS 173.52]
MVRQQGIDSDKYVFLVDVRHLCPPSNYERKSAINSHAAKRMHLKRRQSRKEQLGGNEMSVLMWQGLRPRGLINENRSWWTDTDSGNAGMAIKTRTAHGLTNYSSSIPTSCTSIHCSVSISRGKDLDISLAEEQNFDKCPLLSSQGCLAALKFAQNCFSNSFAAQRDLKRPPSPEASETQLIHDCAFRFSTDFNKDDRYSRSETYPTDSSVRPGQAGKMRMTPTSLIGSGKHDPFAMCSFTSTKEDYMFFHFCEQSLLHFSLVGTEELISTWSVHNTVAEIVFGYGLAAPLFYLRLVSQRFIHDEAVIQLTLAYSSYAWHNLFRKDECCERKGLMHKIKGMELVIKKLGHPQSAISDSTIQAAIILSAIEVSINAEVLRRTY